MYHPNNVSLSIAKGEFFGLLGPNGAGKSTLINIIAGLARADNGTVAILGHDSVRDYRQARRNLGMVPQELVFDPFFTVREILRIQSGYYGLGHENDDWIDELIAILMLSDKAHTNMRALSGGMKRRVLIAQALVHKPEVVVLDEPTAGGVGRTVRVIITAAEPVHDLPAELSRLTLRCTANQLELQLNRDTDSIVKVVDAVRAAGITIVDLCTEEADLEDVFIELTGHQTQ